ncbi:PIR Superfamily Protein [Plasmodium ovale wallikeri]|uniref:PIR Superfamily Protein n=1 Tax=Plasmodium ovale wallikeri TaxID=864142 RepID=A0A1A9A919_PLAOA|nr:PIR Superfamily Protein [Plasmodium ovale wallikeri]SBT57966.1 PIR Superfamily Protein [Plasmodium ovale wallikeri]
MDSNITEDFFQKLGQRIEFLMNFDLYNIYKTFSDIYGYNSYSNGLCDIYLGGHSQTYTDIHSVCKKIENIFNNFFKETNELITHNKNCEHLSYFIYAKIKNLAINSNVVKFYEALNYAKGIYGLNDDNCKIKIFHNNKEEFDKMKELYLRNEILQEIKDKYDNLSTDNDEFYKKYITESANLYNEIVTNFCKYDEYYKKILTEFSSNFGKTKEFLKQKIIEIQEVNKQLSPIPTCKPEEEGAISPQAQVKDLHDQQGMDNPEGFAPRMKPSSNFDTGKNSTAGIVSGILIGTCSLFFIIYKLTPLGSSLNNKIWRAKNKINLEDNSDEIILGTSDNENMLLSNNMYNIQYHSV